MKAFSIVGVALSYLKSYLDGRMYCVRIGNEYSRTLPLARGGPHGSVLGPILFCVYTSGLSELTRKFERSFIKSMTK